MVFQHGELPKGKRASYDRRVLLEFNFESNRRKNPYDRRNTSNPYHEDARAILEIAKKLSLEDFSEIQRRLRNIIERAEREEYGLFNKKALQYRIQDFLKEKGDKGVIIIDLNNLKKINDSFGHEAGDDYIRAKALAFRELSKKYAFSVARTGGDEFELFFLHKDEESVNNFVFELYSVAKEKWLEIKEKKNYSDLPDLSFAYGFAWRREEDIRDMEQYEEMRKEADLRMYQNKRNMKGLNASS